MSYEIEYKGEVYKDVSEKSSEPSFLLVITAGDNNVYELGNRRRSRDTYIVAYGWNYSIVQEICKRAGSCEGGGLQPGNKYMSPEDYLKRYRNKIKNAPSINEFYKQCNLARFRLIDDPEGWQLDYFEKYKEFIHKEPDHYHPEMMETWCEIRIKDAESFRMFRDLWCLAKYGRYVGIVSSGVVTPHDFEELMPAAQNTLEGYE